MAKATCSECGVYHDTVRMCQKLNPRNWHPERRRLCVKCRQTVGFQPVEYGTSYMEAKRPW